MGRGVRRLDAVQEIAVRDALRGERPPRGQLVEPEPGHVGGAEAVAVPLEEEQPEHGEVEVVVLGHAVDGLGERGGAAVAVPRIPGGGGRVQADFREPVAQRPVAGGAGEGADAGQRQRLDRLAEQTPGRPPQPGGLQAGAEGLGRGVGAESGKGPGAEWGRVGDRAWVGRREQVGGRGRTGIGNRARTGSRAGTGGRVWARGREQVGVRARAGSRVGTGDRVWARERAGRARRGRLL